MEKWQCKISDWTKIPKEIATLYLSQADAALKETVETSKTITAKADRIFSIVLPIFSALVAFLFNSIAQKKFTQLELAAGLALIPLVICLYFSYKNIGKYEVAVPGLHPKHLMTDGNLNPNLKENEQQLISLTLLICESIQDKIDRNIAINTSRTNKNVFALKVLLWVPAAPIIAYPLYELHRYYHFLLP
jgi:hypothetical protein